MEKWWGEDKHYFIGMYNVDKINIKVINDEDRSFDYFKKGELDYYFVSSAKSWTTKMDFESLKKGYVHRKRVFVDMPQGLYGLVVNLRVPLFQDKEFRKGLEYLFNFEELNEKMMFNAYYRGVSVFEGTEYENTNLKPYTFDPKKAREHLNNAGFRERGEKMEFLLIKAGTGHHLPSHTDQRVWNNI